MGGFVLCPIFSVHFLHPRVDFPCHNPVTLAALFEFDILIYSLCGFMELGASPCSPPQRSLYMLCGEGRGSHDREKKGGEGFDASAEDIQTMRMVFTAQWMQVTHDCSAAFRQPARGSAAPGVIAGQGPHLETCSCFHTET